MVSEMKDATDRNFRHFGPFFALSASWQPGKSKFEHWKETPGDIIILHICTTNYNHTIYGSWDMKHDRHNFLSFWTVFCPFTPLWTQKIKIFKKLEKIPEDVIISQRYTTVIWCMVPKIWSAMDRMFCHFGPSFALLTP